MTLVIVNTTTLALAYTVAGTMTSNFNTIITAVIIHLWPLTDSGRWSGSLVACNGSLTFQ